MDYLMYPLLIWSLMDSFLVGSNVSIIDHFGLNLMFENITFIDTYSVRGFHRKEQCSS